MLDEVVGDRARRGGRRRRSSAATSSSTSHHRPEAERIVYDALLALRADRHPGRRRRRATTTTPSASARVEPLLRRGSASTSSPRSAAPTRAASSSSARDGTTRCQIACLPWVAERLLFGAAELMGLAGGAVPGVRRASCRASSRRSAPASTPASAPCSPPTSSSPGAAARRRRARADDRPDLRRSTPQALPTTSQYIALGHVHRPQDVPGAAAPARYAGSLLQLDFGEASQAQERRRSSTLEPGRPARVRERPARRPAGSCCDVRGTLDELEQYRDSADDALGCGSTLVCDGPQPGLADARARDPAERARGAARLSARGRRDGAPASSRRCRRASCSRATTATRHGAEPTRAALKLFDELLDEVTAVRPLRLEIEGFTAFRRPQEIDFTELDLFVITGPTGAGKTQHARRDDVRALRQRPARQRPRAARPDLARLRVHARPSRLPSRRRRYRVARRMGRNTHEATLERIEDGSSVTELERGGIRAVNDRLEEIVGLDFRRSRRRSCFPRAPSTSS